MDVSNGKTVLTQKGYEDLQRELNEIVTVKRPAVVNRIREALQLGDLRENFDYHDAKKEQGLLEARVAYLKDVLDNAVVMVPSENNGHVTIGSKVVVKDLEDGFEEEYTLVGAAESSPLEGKISNESSVGAALMDKKAGDVVEVETPGGTVKYEIVSVE